MPVPPTTPTSGLIPTVSIQRVLEVGKQAGLEFDRNVEVFEA
jgi:hypothetical protein